MRWTILAPAVSLAALLAAPVSASLSDFRLPAPSTQQPGPDRQGPVAPDVPESRRPPAPAPTASREPAPTPAPTAAAPRIVPPEPSDATLVPTPTRTARAAAPTPGPAATGSPTTAAEVPSPAGGVTDGLGFPAPESTSGVLPVEPPTPTVAAPAEEGGSWWPWALAAVALGALGVAGWLWRQRRQAAGPGAMPEIERPRVAPALAPAAPAPAGEVSPEPLQVTLEPLRLSLTLMNATLAYRLEIANRGAAPIAGLRIGADMISAHASMTREQQLSGPGAGAATLQRIDRLEPGESRIVEGEFRVPFTQIVPIRQGNAALLLPLARFRLETEAAAPVVRTFVVGQPGAKAGLQPFRLDQGPRVYPKLTQRAFA
jgi:hypothetical protein